MADEEPLSRREVEALLAYAEATHRTVTSFRRRVAAAALVAGVVFAMVAAFATLQWLSTRAEIATVTDEPLAEVLGVRIPDPRPAIERGELRVRALLWAALAFAAGVSGALSLAVFAMVRPGPVPPAIREAAATSPRGPPG